MLKDLHYEPHVKLVTQPLNFHAFITLSALHTYFVLFITLDSRYF